MIAAVVLFQNGLVMAFDEGGRQLPEYQGRFAEVKDRVYADAPPNAVFERRARPGAHARPEFPNDGAVPRFQWMYTDPTCFYPPEEDAP